MKSINTLKATAGLIFITAAFTLLCEPALAAYCTAGSSACDEYISDVHIGTIHNTGTGCSTGGYFDYTAITTEVEIGKSYQITVTNGIPYSQDQCGIWIDWNQDEDFDDPCETISVGGDVGDFQAVITVPAGVALGQTRLRIRIMYTGTVSSCGTASYGEVEDYSVEVIPSGTYEIIHESATMGDFGQNSGWVLDSSSFIGSRFHIDQQVDVSTIGGHLLKHTAGTIFGAIVSLSGPAAFPTGSPFDPGEVIGSVIFELSDASMDFRVPLSATLPAGDYALIFGNSQFGASTTSIGLMPDDGQSNLPGASYLVWDGSTWGNDGSSIATRFAIEGIIDTGGEYCSASGTCDDVSIGRVEFRSINNGWTGCDGYADYTNLSASVELGKGYPLTVSYHNNYYPSTRIWVDWNHDYDFNDLNEEITGIRHNEEYSELYSATIKAPLDAALGSTRMRIRIYNVYGSEALLPCGETSGNGEVEDYNIIVVEPNTPVVSAFPYYEDFISGFGMWNPSVEGDFDWVWINQYWHIGDRHYLKAESSGHSNETAIIESAAFDISGLTNPIVRFLWDTDNSSPSTLFLDVSQDNGQSWSNLWTSSDGGGKVNVDLPTNTPQLKLRFRAFMDGDDTEMKYIYVGECTVPEKPPSSFAIPEKTFISWLWQYVSTDNDGYKGYDENDTLMWTVSSSTYAKAEFGLSSNTMYSRKVRAYNYCGDGQLTELITSWTLPESPSVSCDRTANDPTWPPGTLFTFTNNRVLGSGGVDHYHYVWDQNPSYSFAGSEPNWSGGTLQLTENSIGQHYLHVLSHNGEHNDNGTANLGPYVVGIPDPHTSEIHGIKFHDLNGDGAMDTGEPNLSDWNIYIDLNENSQWDDSEPCAITGVDGHYAITNLASGTYIVAEVLQPDWWQTFPGGSGTHSVTVAIGEVAEQCNFGNKLLPGEIHGVKWSDQDANGVQDAGEIGLEGWTIYVDVNENGQWDIGEPCDLTDSSGIYSITDLSPGTYVVTEVNQVGWEQTFPGGAGTHSVSVGANQIIEDIDFGNYPLPGRIVGTKWYDLDGNGIRDAGERYLQDWIIYLDLNDNGQCDSDEPNTITNADGYYEFTNLPTGTYTIAEIRRDGWFQTTPLVKPQSGNLFVVVDEEIVEYSVAGQIINTINIPFEGSDLGYHARDITVSQENDIYVYNGTFGAVLSKLDRDTNQWTHYDITGLSTFGDLSSGGIASFQNYIFLTDENTGGAPEKGIVRFNLVDLSYERFADDIQVSSYIDLNIGLDGLLYILAPGGEVFVYDPLSLEQLRHFYLHTGSDYRAIAANALGEVFLVSWGGSIYKFDLDGYLLNSIGCAGDRLVDIDISKNGTIVVSSIDQYDIFLTDVSLYSCSSFSVGSWQVNDIVFSTFANLTFSYTVEIDLNETVIVDFGNYTKTLPGDFVWLGWPDGVDLLDFAVFADQWQLPELSADIGPDGSDGFVDYLDWAAFANAWQSTADPLSANWDPACDVSPEGGDGIVDVNDLLVFADQWLQFSAYCADIAPPPHGDGLVDLLDLIKFVEDWLADTTP